MPRVDEVARSVLASINSDTSLLLTSKWVGERYANLVSRTRFRHLRKVGEFVARGVISTGTVFTTQGSNVVTGISTAWTADIEGRHFRAANSWYEIAKWISATELRLKSSFTETAVTAAAYKIAQRYITIDPIARWLGDSIVMARSRQIIDVIPLEMLDMLAPGRLLHNANWPHHWCNIGSALNSDGKQCKQIEIYPPLTSDELFYYVYWEIPNTLDRLDDEVPSEVDLFVLKEGVLIDAMRNEAAKSAKAGKVEEAAYWRNEYRMQSTSWEKDVIKAIQADKTVDDSTFIMQTMLGGGSRGDIRTARDEVYARGNRS